MKWLFLLLVPLAFLLGCSSVETVSSSKEKLTVLSTTVMIGDVVSYIGGDKIASSILIGRELDPHSYEFVKGDDEKLMEADIIFYNGLGLEHGASVRRFLESSEVSYGLGNVMGKESPELLIRMNGIYDPHIWMDVSLWQRIIPLIVKVLSEKDTVHSAYFAEKGQELFLSYSKLHKDICQKMQEIPEEKRYLVTSHDAFNYFTRAYLARHWQSRVFSPEGLAPDGQISLQDLRIIIEKMKEHSIHVLFPEAYVSVDPLKKIQDVALREGFNVHLSDKPLYSDSIPPGSSYEMMMSYNAGVIHAQLTN